jgi:hypothetical protein
MKVGIVPVVGHDECLIADCETLPIYRVHSMVLIVDRPFYYQAHQHNPFIR